MRVSNAVASTSILNGITSNRSKMNNTQTKLSTGVELEYASQNPIDFSRAARIRKNVANNEQYLRNMQTAEGWLASSENMINSIVEMGVSSKNLAIKGADFSLSSSDRVVLADSVLDTLKEMVSTLNNRFSDKYLFAGTKVVGDQPFSLTEDDAGNVTVDYLGNAADMFRKIDDANVLKFNVSGQEFLDSGVIESMITLYDNLRNDDATATNLSIDELTQAGENLLRINASLGDKLQRISASSERLTNMNLEFSALLSGIEDVDMAEAMIDYNNEELAYRASLQAGSDILTTSILDYLR